MANTGEPGSINPGSSGTHPRMSAPLPTGPGSATSRTHSGGTQKPTTGSGVADRIGDAWDSAREGVRQGAQAVAQRAQTFWTDARDLIGRRPMAALAIAFCAGWAFGCLTAGSWSRSEDDMTQRMSRASA